MVGEPSYARDLFAGTADHYARFRPPYPIVLLDDLRREVPLDHRSRVLDLACGTGQIAIPLAPHVGEVLAVDQEGESVDVGRHEAKRLGVANIQWITASAEVVELRGGFDLVTIGNAFHRLDREAVATRVVRHLSPRGCVALLWSDTPWRGEQSWQHVLQGVLDRWKDELDANDRIPSGWEEAIERDRHDQVLRRAGLTDLTRSEYSVTKQWSVGSLLGFVYSTSFLNLSVVGKRANAFERDLRTRLLACRPEGIFDQELTFSCELARRAAG